MLVLALAALLLGAACEVPDAAQIRLRPSWHRESVSAEDEVSDLAITAALPASGPLDLPTAHAIALRDNPDVHRAQARLAAAAARIAEAIAAFYPTVVLTHSSARTFQVPASLSRINSLSRPQFLPAGTQLDAGTVAGIALLNAIPSPLIIGNSVSEHASALTASYVLFDGFVRDARALGARHLYRASAAHLEDVRRLIINSVDAAYYQVQLAEEDLRIAKADEVFSQEQYDQSKKLAQAGRASDSDVGNFRVRVLAAQAELAAVAGRRDAQRVALAELMGISGSQLPSNVVLSPLAPETDADMTSPDQDDWVAEAYTNRPDLKQLQHSLASAEQNVRAAVGSFYPTLNLSGSWGFNHTSSMAYSADDQSSAGTLELRWELFTGGARLARLRSAQSRRAEAVANLDRRRLLVESQVRSRVIAVISAQETIRLQRENLATARENRRVIRAGYNAGKETLVRLNEAQRDYIAADAKLALARIRLRQEWSNLRSAAGTERD